VDVVDERWLLIEEGAYARRFAGFCGVMDRMILGCGRRHEPLRRITHVRGIILASAISRGAGTALSSLCSWPAFSSLARWPSGCVVRERAKRLCGLPSSTFSPNHCRNGSPAGDLARH